jgi:hypothetical protein
MTRQYPPGDWREDLAAWHEKVAPAPEPLLEETPFTPSLWYGDDKFTAKDIAEWAELAAKSGKPLEWEVTPSLLNAAPPPDVSTMRAGCDGGLYVQQSTFDPLDPRMFAAHTWGKDKRRAPKMLKRDLSKEGKARHRIVEADVKPDPKPDWAEAPWDKSSSFVDTAKPSHRGPTIWRERDDGKRGACWHLTKAELRLIADAIDGRLDLPHVPFQAYPACGLKGQPCTTNALREAVSRAEARGSCDPLEDALFNLWARERRRRRPRRRVHIEDWVQGDEMRLLFPPWREFLTDVEIGDIVQRHKNGETIKQLAEDYGQRVGRCRYSAGTIWLALHPERRDFITKNHVDDDDCTTVDDVDVMTATSTLRGIHVQTPVPRGVDYGRSRRKPEPGLIRSSYWPNGLWERKWDRPRWIPADPRDARPATSLWWLVDYPIYREIAELSIREGLVLRMLSYDPPFTVSDISRVLQIDPRAVRDSDQRGRKRLAKARAEFGELAPPPMVEHRLRSVATLYRPPDCGRLAEFWDANFCPAPSASGDDLRQPSTVADALVTVIETVRDLEHGEAGKPALAGAPGQRQPIEHLFEPRPRGYPNDVGFSSPQSRTTSSYMMGRAIDEAAGAWRWRSVEPSQPIWSDRDREYLTDAEIEREGVPFATLLTRDRRKSPTPP